MRANKQCRITGAHWNGDTVSYHMSCSGQMQMEGDGTFQMLGDGGVHGQITAAGSAGGRHMAMDMTIDGKRVGDCDYKPPQVAQ